MAPPKKGDKKGQGFHSAAGLIRYFDAEEEIALKIDPRLVLGFCVITCVMIYVANWLWPV